jgi:mannose-6-phosphate isomerase-like protein (cupin superfamily)
MKFWLVASSFLAGVLLTVTMVSFSGNQKRDTGYIIEHEKDIAKEEPGPHKGGGLTTAYSFFSQAPDVQLVFRKRVLYPGSSIGYHLQERDEIYYIAGGHGELMMNGKAIEVRTGDAVLTRAGNSHGLKPYANDSLVVIINYTTN